MSDVIRRAAKRIVRSQAFLEVFSELVAVEMERQLRHEAAGEQIYVTKTSCMAERNERNQLIKSCFTGTNSDFLSKKFGLTKRHIERICKKK